MKTHCNCCYPVCPTPLLDIECKSVTVGKCGFLNSEFLMGRDYKTYKKHVYADSQSKATTTTKSNSYSYEGSSQTITGSCSYNSVFTLSKDYTTTNEKETDDVGLCKSVPEDHDGNYVERSVGSSSETGNTMTPVSASWNDTDTRTWTTNTNYDDPTDDPDQGVIGEVTYVKSGQPDQKTSPSDDFTPPASTPPETHTPQKWHGIWEKIQIAEIFTPFDHDPENPASPQPVVTDKEVIWTGPGDELETHPDWDTFTDVEKEARRDSWTTAWVDIDVPATEGETTAYIKRSQCYHGAPWAIN